MLEYSPLVLPTDHVGLYIHIPFCFRKCRYCDFASRQVLDDGETVRYIAAMAHESQLRLATLGRPLHSIYIGGGTPSLLGGEVLRQLWREVIAPFPRIETAEITLEVNPHSLTHELLQAIAELPINRVSLGAQSLQAAELRLLGRLHSPQEVIDGVQALRNAGIAQINVDLIYGIPAQNINSWRNTLRGIAELNVEHLSLYSLIIEDDTPFASDYAAGNLPLPDENEVEQMELLTTAWLAKMGYNHYEVSNAAQAGCQSRHNLGYWLGRDYLGLGAGAVSTVNGLRWQNIADPTGYIARSMSEKPLAVYLEKLAAPARLLEMLMLGLRLRAGVELAAMEQIAGCSLREIAPQALRQLQGEGLLELQHGILRLTNTGYAIANSVSARLMADVQTGG